jgi:transposase
MHQAGFKVSVVNPRLSRDFERAEGKLGKTDAIDAQQLADYGRTMQPAPTTPAVEHTVLLDELVNRRAQLVEDCALSTT